MKKVKEIRQGRHCIFLLHAHLVFVTKHRHGVFTKAVLDDLKEIFASVCLDFEAELAFFDGEDDHVHLLVTYPPKVALSSLVNSLKGVSGRLIRKRGYPSIQNKLWGGSLCSQAILQAALARRQSPYCGNISNRNGHRIKNKFQLMCALYPRPKGRGFTARVVKTAPSPGMILP